MARCCDSPVVCLIQVPPPPPEVFFLAQGS